LRLLFRGEQYIGVCQHPRPRPVEDMRQQYRGVQRGRVADASKLVGDLIQNARDLICPRPPRQQRVYRFRRGWKVHQ